MAELVWTPQESFADYFLTDANEIIKQRTVFNPLYNNFVSRGGRGSAKTFTWADAVVIEASLRPVRILVTREIQLSIDESIKAELEAAIISRGLENFFDIQKTTIIGANGSKFIFKGLKNNITNIKSISDVEIVLCEEAENISKNSWDKLLPSIRPKSGASPIIIVIYNPEDELDDTHQRWTVSPPPKTINRLINWRDNKYFPEYLNDQRIHCQKTQPKKDYDNIWEGKPKGSDDNVIIDKAWIKAARHASRHPLFEKLGDRGVGYDPAGQGRDFNATVYADGNVVESVDEWLKSDDLREATKRAFNVAVEHRANTFTYDECGGFGDGVSVFVSDEQERKGGIGKSIDVHPFSAGSGVAFPDYDIEGTDKTNGETYTNAKAQGWGMLAQRFYNTYRFIVLDDQGIDPLSMISLDIDDDDLFIKLIKELSSPIWVKSQTNSKKKVESKEAMFKRCGQPSPNIADALVMVYAPWDGEQGEAGTFDW